MNSFFTALWSGLRGGMARFGEDIATLVNTLLLLVVYVLGVGITAIIARIAGKKFLDRKPSPVKGSYWRNTQTKKPDLESHFRQF